MKRLLSSLLVAVFAVALMASGAWAASSIAPANATGVTADALVFDQFKSNSKTYEIAATAPAAPLSVAYTAGKALAIGNTFTVTLAGGKFKAGEQIGLCKVVSGGSDTDVAPLVTVPTGGAYTLEFTLSDNVGLGDVLLLTTALPGGAADYAAGDAPTYVVDEDSKVVTASVPSVYSPTLGEITDAHAPAKTIIASANGVAIAVGGTDSNIIDVKSGRKTFTLDPSGNAAVDASVETLTMTVDNNSVDDQLSLVDGDDAFTLSIFGTFTNIKTVTLAGIASHTVTDAERTAGQVDIAVADASDCPLTVAKDLTFTLLDEADRVAMSVTSYTYTIAFTKVDNSTLATLTAADNAPLATWGINGYQAKIPYMLAKTDKHTVLRLVNQGSESADVTIDMMGSNGETATVEYTGADGVPANGSKYFTALDIMNAATGWTGGDIYTATVTMTVSNEVGLIEAYVWSDLGYRPTTTYDTHTEGFVK